MPSLYNLSRALRGGPGQNKYYSSRRTRAPYQSLGSYFGFTTKSRRSRKSRAGWARKNRMNPRAGGFIGQELKYVDQIIPDVKIKTTLALMTDVENGDVAKCLHGISQDNTESGRIGRQYTVRSIHVKGQIHLPQTSTAGQRNDQRIAVYMIQDTQTNGAQMTGGQCFEAIGAGHPELLMNNLENTGRFRILASKMIVMKSGDSTFVGPNYAHPKKIQAFSFYKKMNMRVTCATGVGGTISSIKDNSVHLLAIASQDDGTQNMSHMEGLVRTRFSE